jgi:hypothetical protein
VVAELADAKPPKAAESESTSRMRFRPGSRPFSSSQPASPAIPMTVPMVSKKSASMMEKTLTIAVTAPARQKTERSRPRPTVEKSGQARICEGMTATPGMVKAVRPLA